MIDLRFCRKGLLLEQNAQTKHQPAGLARRVGKGAGWVFGVSTVALVLRLISNLIMVRYLQPDAFGLIALAVLAHVAVELMTDIGIGQSIVREKDGDTSRFLCVAWTVQLIRSICIAMFILLIAAGFYFFGPHIGAPGSVYGRAESPIIIAFLALSALFKGAESTNVFLARRHLEYSRISVLELGSQVIALLFMVAAVQFSPTVWVLLGGILVGAACRLILSHLIVSGPRMGLAYDRDVRVRLWRFGKWIMASSALNYIATHADALILGGLLGAATFGVYTIANTWIQGATMILRKFGDEVGYSAFAEVINTRPDDLPRVFGRYMQVMNVLVTTGFLCCASLARPFVDLLYPSAFEEAGLYLQLMAPILLLFRFTAHMNILTAMGNSRAIATVSLLRSVAMCVFVPVGFSLGGVLGAVVAASLARASAIPYAIFLTNHVLKGSQVSTEWVWYIAALSTVPIILTLQ